LLENLAALVIVNELSTFIAQVFHNPLTLFAYFSVEPLVAVPKGPIVVAVRGAAMQHNQQLKYDLQQR
jgi:hypothetical protein